MNKIALKQYYPAGGRADNEVEITDIKPTKREGVFVGRTITPMSVVEKPVVIYQLELPNNTIEYRAVPSACPHQGVDISNDELKQDGNVYCSLHRRPICIYSEYNQAYLVEKRAERFYIAKTASS